MFKLPVVSRLFPIDMSVIVSENSDVIQKLYDNLGGLFGGDGMTITDWIQAISMLILVVVTCIYAWRTFAISKATKQQADASMEMANTSKEQLLSEAKPYLILRLAHEVVQWNGIDLGNNPLQEFQVTMRNVGKGPAVNILAGLWHRTEPHEISGKGYLKSGEEWQADIVRVYTGIDEHGNPKDEAWLPELREIVKQDYVGIIAVKYQDIYKNTWVNYLRLVRITGHEDYVAGMEQNIVELKKND